MGPDTRLHHELLGEGDAPPVLFLHGFLGSGRNLRSLARRVMARREGLRVALVDLPGHGRSPPFAPGDDLGALAGRVLELATALHPGAPARVVGHSLGGRIALAMARVAPGDVDTIALLDIGPGALTRGGEVGEVVELLAAAPATAPDRDTMRAQLTGAGLSRPMADWLLMNLDRDPAGHLGWRIDRELLREAHARWGPEEDWEVVERDPSPVRLCVRGARSSYVPDADALRMEQAGVPVETLEGAGHFVHMDAPDALASLLAGVL